MNKELYVSSTPHETKVALVEDDQLAEVFFERENEYTLAGSIYKGRVTRVLPGMQSAFVDIGLERDAFLYVSDFLELSSDEEDEDFGDIPAPRTAVELGSSQAPSEAQPSRELHQPVLDAEAEFEGMLESDTPLRQEAKAEEGEGEGEENVGPSSGAQEPIEGARRWRGRRRRRGGRRGRGEDRLERADVKTEQVDTGDDGGISVGSSPETGPQQRQEPRSAPTRYAPIILPGESISKYRNLAQQPAPAPVAGEQLTSAPAEPSVAPATDFVPSHEGEEMHRQASEVSYEPQAEEQERAGHPATEPEQLERAAMGFAHGKQFDGEAHEADFDFSPPAGSDAGGVEVHERGAARLPGSEQEAQSSSFEDETSEGAEERASPEVHESEYAGGATVDENARFPHHAAPSVAPEGRTLEHEVLEDDEMEFHPVPENIEALSEVAGDEELVLEEEIMDRDENGSSDRWVPKIADVDEEDVLAAEERGETFFEDGKDAAEEAEEEAVEEVEGNGRAELRAAAPTAGYQLRHAERPGYDRRFQRGRRGGRRNDTRPRPGSHRPLPLITDLLKEGQEVLIQIAKEPIGKKGARITSHIALPGRFLVYMPTVNHVGVSRKIASDEERQRLKRIVTSERENGIGGFIVRTAAANIKEDELRSDIRFLKHLWAEIKNRAENSKAPALIYHDLNLVERVLRDQVNADFSQIWVDTEEQYERVVRFAGRFQPSLVKRIKLYTKDTPLFEQFAIQEEIDRSLKSKVWLKSGGYLVINQTEALVAIDINTGKYVGKTQRLEDTIVKTNVDAVREIVRQIRLRDLGGIIVIDFIDMDERRNRQKVMQALEEALRWDRAPSKVLQFNDFGLVAITRKRVKQSLERTLGEPCPYCTGAGFVKSVTTVCNELYIEMRKMAKAHDHTDITVRVNPEVAKALKANNGKLISELEELTGKTVLVKNDPALHQENFDIH
jgi:ribonuclease G